MIESVRTRRLVGAVSAALVCGLGVIGSSAARPDTRIHGITINAQLNVVALNVALWGFFTKPGVSCKDFKGSAVPNRAIDFGTLVVLSHPENGRAGCLVEEKTITFWKEGTIPFQIKLKETGAFKGTDIVDDVAIVAPSTSTAEADQAKVLVEEAIEKEDAALRALKRFEKTGNDDELKTAEVLGTQAKLKLKKAHKLELPGAEGTLAKADIAKAEDLDDVAVFNLGKAITERSSKTVAGLVQNAEDALGSAYGDKHLALFHLDKA